MATFDTALLDALSVPLGDLISSVGRGVADAQHDLDVATIDSLRELYAASAGTDLDLQAIGYRPNWYHIPQADGEIQVALTVTGEGGSPAGAIGPVRRIKVYAAPVDAGYSSRFNFTLEAASKLSFRIVPIPPSSAAEGLRVAPVLVGLTVAEARARLALLGIPGEFGTAADSAAVTAQDPAPGTILAEGGTVTIRIT
jgi:hypothetical protein